MLCACPSLKYYRTLSTTSVTKIFFPTHAPSSFFISSLYKNILPLKPSAACLEIVLLPASKSTQSGWSGTRCSAITSSRCVSDYTSEEQLEGGINYYRLYRQDQHLAEIEKRTIHISTGDAKVDPSLKSNAQLQSQARANEDTHRKCFSGTGNSESKLTVKHCKSSLKNWEKKRSF